MAAHRKGKSAFLSQLYCCPLDVSLQCMCLPAVGLRFLSLCTQLPGKQNPFFGFSNAPLYEFSWKKEPISTITAKKITMWVGVGGNMTYSPQPGTNNVLVIAFTDVRESFTLVSQTYFLIVKPTIKKLKKFFFNSPPLGSSCFHIPGYFIMIFVLLLMVSTRCCFLYTI